MKRRWRNKVFWASHKEAEMTREQKEGEKLQEPGKKEITGE